MYDHHYALRTSSRTSRERQHLRLPHWGSIGVRDGVRKDVRKGVRTDVREDVRKGVRKGVSGDVLEFLYVSLRYIHIYIYIYLKRNSCMYINIYCKNMSV